jgi:hypothetical protein
MTKIAANDNELWLVSPTSGDYEVSSLGRVRRVTPDRFGRGGNRVLKPRPLPTGYLRYTESTDGKNVDRYIHRTVCHAFNGPPPSPSHEVAHRDGCKANNRPENLYWATHVQNEADKVAHGTRLAGERVGNSKLTAEAVAKIRTMIGTAPQRVIAAKFGVTQMVISKIHRGQMWRSAA